LQGDSDRCWQPGLKIIDKLRIRLGRNLPRRNREFERLDIAAVLECQPVAARPRQGPLRQQSNLAAYLLGEQPQRLALP
jgi:hypothetical protein